MIVPCYNEQEVLGETSAQLKAKYTCLIENKLISPESRIVFVNDGSKDETWNISRNSSRASTSPTTAVTRMPSSQVL